MTSNGKRRQWLSVMLSEVSQLLSSNTSREREREREGEEDAEGRSGRRRKESCDYNESTISDGGYVGGRAGLSVY